MTKAAPLAALLALSLITSACGGSADQAPGVDPGDRQAGAEQHEQLLAEFGGAYDGPESDYVAAVGEKIANAAGLSDQCTFTLVNTDVVNAFAVPGCYIYVTRGLLGIVNSEAELASVLGHELGHIVGDHSQRQQRGSILRGIGVVAVSILTGSERLTRIAGQAAQYFTLRYSREQEYESDDLGIRYLQAAGYDPYAAGDMLVALGRNERFESRQPTQAKSIPEWARTHPLTDNRINRARVRAAASGLADDQLPENEAAYLTEVDGLLYGDDPEQGFVLGRRFAHPLMRISFEAPQGYTLTNSPQAILIEGPSGVRGEFGGGLLPPAGLVDYVERLIGQVLGQTQGAVGPFDRTRINGVPAVTVPIRVSTSEGEALLWIAAYAAPDGRQAFHFLLAGSGDGNSASANSLFSSFRFLSDTEAAVLRPRRIAVVAGRNVQSLATSMAGEPDPAAAFLMLNGLTAANQVRPEGRYKIVRFAER